MSGELTRREGGFTVIELIIVIVLFTALGLSLLSIFSSSGTAVAEMHAGADADVQLLRVIDRLHDELDFADPANVTLVDPQTLIYAVVEGWDGNAPILGPARQLTLGSGALAIDGQVIIAGLTDGEMSLSGDILEIELTTQGEYLHGGAVAPVERRSIVVHRLGN